MYTVHMHMLWHDNHRKWFRLPRDMTPWSWLWYPQKTSIFTIFGPFSVQTGRCINRSVLHLRRPTNISICTLNPCTYYAMTTIGNSLDCLEIWPPEVDFGIPQKTSMFTFLGLFQSKPGHVPRCINRSVLQFLEPGHIAFETGDCRQQNDTRINKKR